MKNESFSGHNRFVKSYWSWTTCSIILADYLEWSLSKTLLESDRHHISYSSWDGKTLQMFGIYHKDAHALVLEWLWPYAGASLWSKLILGQSVV